MLQASNNPWNRGASPGSVLQDAQSPRIEVAAKAVAAPQGLSPCPELTWVSSAQDLPGRNLGPCSGTDGLPRGPHLPGNTGAVALCSAEQNLVYFPLVSAR